MTLTSLPILSQADYLATLEDRFGADPMAWAFTCPQCGDVATGADFRAALDERPATRRDGTPSKASDFLGQQCIGRVLGALAERRQQDWKGRGCDWVAFGLFRGPQMVSVPGEGGEERLIPSFVIAPAAGV